MRPDGGLRMRIFITGATGFIGRALTLRLLGGGHEVAAWVRSQARAASLLGPDVELIAASGGDQALSAEVARAGAVINLAGEPVLGGRWSASRREAISRSRIGLTKSIADAIERAAETPRGFGLGQRGRLLRRSRRRSRG